MPNLENIKCPKCGAQKFLAEKKGFDTKNFIAWSLIKNTTWGLFAGSIGANKVIVTCLNCKQQFKVEDDAKSGFGMIILMVIFWLIVIAVIVVSVYNWVCGLFT
jgi:uncharacterized membrane protein